ncbi:MAG TPA: AAA family ATPase [Pyrinomonadaceae bacterium]|nr:AAA family ATPase [Pyrinomonadaceae bacterium]
MITKIKINGFKTFHNFEMEFSPLTIVAGVNASGKSNLFDALQLLSRLAETDLKTAFKEQRGESSELFTNYGEDESGESLYADEITFSVEMLIDKKVKDNWGGEATLKYTRLRYDLCIRRDKDSRGIDNLFVKYEKLEKLDSSKDQWEKVFIPSEVSDNWRPKVITGKRSKPYIYTEEKSGVITIKLPQDGKPGGKETAANAIAQTVLSGTNSVDFPHVFAAREEMRNWKFLQLNPQSLREPTRQDLGSQDTITQTGENLAAALYRIKLDEESLLKHISRRLNKLLPQITEVQVHDDKANKQYIIKVKNDDGREFSSRVLSEGTLRLLTLCILQYDENHKGLICFEEPENGIHPFRLKAMAELLKDLSVDFADVEMPLRQIIVNTHSPVLVSKIFELEEQNLLKVWFSELVTQITTVKNKRLKMYITKMLSVTSPFDDKQRNLDFRDESENRISFQRLLDYLDTADFETIRNKFKINE